MLVKGGHGKNNLNKTYQVEGIGIDKAMQIAWRNLTIYLKNDSQYIDARIGSEKSVIDLFGKDSKEHKAVIDASTG